METIIPITGKVNYQITLDPGVWIFDDRKVELDTYFQRTEEQDNELEKYTKSISKHWDREIMEGAVFPPTLKSERKFEKQRLLEGSFGIPFKSFLLNAEPHDNAKTLLIKHAAGESEMPLSEALELILGFSKEGKPLKDDGPVHVYYGDGSNQQTPITGVKQFIIK
ncbi:hypothetical protein SAMN05192533_11164 [Mesobacillus persicus]|uniref:Peptidyl-prolyl cis-trans isomerase n=1 Tax=Mesobacillus persicus TaxID=930146 RepID=A0A1H8FHN1_9BACI|nr:hypothetical protein [Mesobacillus persicus]SEN31120.1 hypothetical protein SAMN05192533_11164 [Mesobacillus persicus]